MPDVSTSGDSAELAVIGRSGDALQNPLSGDDLVRAHDQEHAVNGEHTILGENVEQGVLGEEGSRECLEILNGFILGISPPRGEFEAVGSLLSRALALIFEVLATGRVRVIFGVSTV